MYTHLVNGFLTKRQVDYHICFSFQSVEVSFAMFMLPLENPTV